MSLTDPYELPHRKSLRIAAGALCGEVGFTNIEESALETLTEILQSYITELGRSSKAYCELAGRTAPMLGDVVMALVEMGADVQNLPQYAKRSKQTVLVPPSGAPPTHNPKILHVGEANSHPSHIPEYLPKFPDPHTYVRSETHKKPVTEYKLIREKAASEKRNVELALTRFIAKTGATESLFEDDPYAFPLIACKPKDLPYLEALLPNDQDLETLDEEAFQHKTKNTDRQKKIKNDPDAAEPSTSTQDPGGQTTSADTSEIDGQIDNPYLREIKMPRLKTSGKKSKYGYLY